MVQYSQIAGLDDTTGSQHMPGIYVAHRSNSSASSSPPATGSNGSAAGLVVPQPINAAVAASTASSKSGGGATSNGSSGGGRKYQCKMCPQLGKVYSSKADLQLHTQIHMREAKPYKCTQCNKSFANSSYLSQHTRIHLGIKPYKCEICQRKFTQLSHLQQHIRTHTGDKPYKCRHPGCTKAFSQLSNLQSHSRCHQTDKPYKCNSCYKCFIDENALLDHIPKHKESKHLKTHICEYCGKSYTQETYLAKHMQKHSDRGHTKGTFAQGTTTATGQAAHLANAQAANTAAAVAVAAGQNNGGGQTLPVAAALGGEAYWQKVDPAFAAATSHDRAGDYAQSLIDSRFNPHAAVAAHRDMVDPRHHMDEQLRAHQAAAAAGHIGGYPSGDPAVVATTTGAAVKTSSAFSPIQGSMLQTAATAAGAAGFPMSAGSRSYTFYDPIGFQKHSQVGFDAKTSGAANCFPNQLISLSQIRNYAHQPTTDLLHTLKEKAGVSQ